MFWLNIKNFFKNRYNMLILLSLGLSIVLVVAIVNLQIVHGDYYRELSDQRMYRTTPIKAPRGEIVDRYGRPLVTNKTAYSIIINDEGQDDAQLNETLQNLLTTLDAYGLTYEDSFPVSLTTPYTYSFDSQQNQDTDEATWKEEQDLDAGMSAQDAVAHFVEEYSIDPTLPAQMQRRLVGLRYDMFSRLFNARNPFTLITGIDMNLVSVIRENSYKFTGVEILTEPVREYPMGTLGAHMLGQVGIIDADEYEQLSSKGYGLNDTLGKDGLEKYLEEYLRGQDGMKSLEYQSDGETLTLTDSVPAVAGNRAVLTIDLNVQQAAETALAEAVEGMYRSGAKGAASGAVVAIEVHSGEVLALASYPSYDPATFKQMYAELVNDPANPLFNRAISGTYSPGSTFKPLTAITGLQEGVITTTETINCNGPYDYYPPPFRPACWIYNDYGGRHGPLNVTEALEVSCNIFFYETARRATIEKLNEYATQFGLGQLTGIELTGEVAGVLAGPAYRESIGEVWYPGDTVQAGIGQSDNLFTPIQMANYVATLANGGTHYKPYLVKDIVANDGSETVFKNEPNVLNSIDIKPENLAAVHEGMHLVTTDGSARTVFGDAPFKAAAKTGTAQVSGGKTPNALFISFAPYENPEIAVAVVVEHGGIDGLGHYVANVARKVFEAYFYSGTAQGDANTTNQLLP